MNEFAPYLRLLGRLHPVVVHFPIALLLTACLFEFFWLLRNRSKRPVPGNAPPNSNPTAPVAIPVAALPAAPSASAVACLLVGVLGAGFASWFGWLWANMGDHSEAALEKFFWHQWVGIAAAAGAFVALLAAWITQWKRPLWAARTYRFMLFLSALLVGLAGHLGGTLVWGDDYIWSALDNARAARSKTAAGAASPSSTASASNPVADSGGFPPAIHALFVAHCVECHGPAKSKGNLRLDTLDHALHAEDVIVPGDAEKSELVRRLTLPPDDPDFMPQPPKGSKEVQPLKPAEIEAIRTWINQLNGQPSEQAATPPRDTQTAQSSGERANPAVATESSSAGKESENASPSRTGAADIALTSAQHQAIEKAIQSILARGGVALKIAANTEALQVNFGLRGPAITDADLETLRGLEPVLEWLDLSNTAISDEGLRRLAGFSRLQRLQLQRTRIGDAGLAQLAPLTQLLSLNLYGTPVTDEGLRHLKNLPGLRRLFLWQTKTTDAGVAELKTALPDLVVEGGLPLAPATAPVAAAKPPQPACCAAAAAQGKTCDHPCCVEAAARGQICEKCLNK